MTLRDVPSKTLMEQPASRTQPLLAPAKTHRSKGCHTRCCWELPAKTLTEQGAAAHVSTLLDVVTTLTNQRAARRIAAGGVDASEGPRDIRKNPHGTRGCRARVQASGCVKIMRDRRAARPVAAGRCRGTWRPQGYPGTRKQKPSRNKGLLRTCPSFWMC